MGFTLRPPGRSTGLLSGAPGAAKQDGTPVKIVVLTQAAYDALSTKDSNTLYVIAG